MMPIVDNSLSPAAEAGGKSAAPALDRGLSVLEFLQRHRRGATVAEVSQALGIPPASAYRLVNTLEARRFIARNRDDGRYRLGPEILLLAGSALAGLDLRAVARPHLQQLFDRTKETVELSMLESDHLVVIDKVEGEESVHTLDVGGHRSPFYESAGLVLLAGLGERRLQAVVGRHLETDPRKMLFGPRRLPAVLEQIRKQGYMADEGPAFAQAQRRARRIAVPLRNHLGLTQAALSLAVSVARWQPERIPRLTRMLMGTARRINELVGYRAPLDVSPGKGEKAKK